MRCVSYWRELYIFLEEEIISSIIVVLFRLILLFVGYLLFRLIVLATYSDLFISDLYIY